MKCQDCEKECFEDKYPRVIFKDDYHCVCEKCSHNYEERNGRIILKESFLYKSYWKEESFMLESYVVKCPICGDPYKFYLFSVADQSACPKCVKKAEDAHGKYEIN